DCDRDLLDLGVADPLADGLVALVHFYAIAVAELPRELLRRPAMVLADRNHPDLDGREPEGERARVVLDQDPDEALEGAVERAVDDVERVLVVVGPHVAEPEARRHLRVELNRPDLPLAPER